MTNPIGPNRAGRSSRPISSLARIKDVIMTAVFSIKHDYSNPLRRIEIHPSKLGSYLYLCVTTYTTKREISEFWPEASTTAEHLSKKGIKHISIGPNVKPEEITDLFQLLGNVDLDWQNFNRPNIKFVK
ncbi:MAG: hypothetical protein WC624_05150 [Candidatus Margulisiibacteriota bacterium]